MAKLRLEKLFGQCVRTSAAKHTTRYIIGFRGRQTYNRILRFLKRKGIRPIKTLRSSRVICCHVDTQLLNNQVRVAALPAGVKFLEKDARVRAHALSTRSGSRSAAPKRIRKSNDGTESNCPSNATWNICRIQAPDAWARTEGDNVRVAVIDTGIAKHNNIAIAGGVNTTGGSSYYDDNGHGTHVAGIVAATGKDGMQPGVAPKASLYAIKALDKDGLGYISDIIQGINWCIRNKIQVINMSFGLLPGEQSAALQESIQNAYKNGIVIVASAGNSGREYGIIDEPASFPEAIAVAASTKTNTIADFSSRGSGIDLTAPGDYIRSLALNNGYTIMSGTSMSCPHVSGGAALLIAANGSLTPEQVAEKLKSWATNLNNYNKSSQGEGLMRLAGIASEAAAAPSSPSVNKRSPIVKRARAKQRSRQKRKVR